MTHTDDTATPVPHAHGDGATAHFDVLPPKRSLRDLAADAERLRGAVTASVYAVVGWSLFEVPWEIDANSSHEEIAGVLVSKTMLFVIAGLALQGRKLARYLLLFVCLTSVLAIAPEMPEEFAHAPWLAVLSSVECAAKLATFSLMAVYLKVVSGVGAGA